MLTPQNPELSDYLRQAYDPVSLDRLYRVLQEKGTLTIRPLASGLFSAAVTTDYSRGTNYHAAWVRDNVHLAYAHLVNGATEVAAATARALCRFFAQQRPRLHQIIAEPWRKREGMQRPHVRFDGDTLAELPQPWAHAQNDALGYFVWFYATVLLRGLIPPPQWDLETLSLFPAYFRAIAYWSDEDSGHWEEAPRVAASSIGTVVAGLRQLQNLARRAADNADLPQHLRPMLPRLQVDDLIARGTEERDKILPAECIQDAGNKKRDYHAALLFLIYPLESVTEDMAETIMARTELHLRGPLGIKRYQGDSFYCTDYETLMARRKDDPTRDFSQNIEARNALLTEGREAQWCLFDPILSVCYGRRYQDRRSPDDLRQ